MRSMSVVLFALLFVGACGQQEADQRNALQRQLDQMQEALNDRELHIAQLELKLSEQTGQLEALRSSQLEVQKSLDERKDALAYLEILRQRHPHIVKDFFVEGEPVPEINGSVSTIAEDAKRQQHMIMAQVDLNDKVKVGMPFIIYRGGDYIAKGTVEKVFASMVAIKLDLEQWNENGLLIEVGDSVMNQRF